MNRPAPRIPRNVKIVAFVALASGFGQDLISPVLPGFLLAIGVSHAGLGLIDGLLQGSTNAFRLVSGFLSDRLRNRKGLMFAGYALSSAARPLLALAGSFGSVAALRMLDGAGKGTKDAPRDALVADSTDAAHRGRAFGFHRLVDTAGSVLGPLLAAGILIALTPSLASYRLIFALSAIPGAIALGLIWFGVREPQPKTTRAPKTAARLPAAYWIFLVGTVVATACKLGDALFLARSQDLGIPVSWIPLAFAAFMLLYAFSSYPLGIWSDRVGRLPLLAGGWALLAAIQIGFALAGNATTAFTLLLGYGLFYALTEGASRALIADLVEEGGRGRAYALFAAATGLATLLGAWGFGALWDAASARTAFTYAAAGTLAGAAIIALSARIRRT